MNKLDFRFRAGEECFYPFEEHSPILSIDFEHRGFMSKSYARPFYFPECEIERFTGMLDRNDKKIYEGDIVKCWDEEPGEVYFDDALLQYRVKFADGDDEDLSSCEPEIVGNTHEKRKGGK